MTEQAYSPGLAGVIAGESTISRIEMEINRLILRGYDLVELTENARYEEVAYLLLYGDLPTAAELGAFSGGPRWPRWPPFVVTQQKKIGAGGGGGKSPNTTHLIFFFTFVGKFHKKCLNFPKNFITVEV